MLRTLLPGNSNLAIAHDAARPKTRLAGTAIAATKSVSLIAATASGAEMACQYPLKPARRASENTATSGKSRNRTRNATATRIKATRARSRSVVTERARSSIIPLAAKDASLMSRPFPLPGLDQIDEKDDDEGDAEHRGGDRGRLRVAEFLELDDDQERRDLRDEGNIAGDEDDRAVLAHGAGESEHEAGKDGRQQRGQHHHKHGLSPARAERGRGLLDLALEIF